MHGHDHIHHSPAAEWKLYVGIFLIALLILAVQIAGGLISGSLALLADSLHVFFDGVSAVISLFVALFISRVKDEERTRLLWMRVSAVVLLLSLLVIGYEAIERLRFPSEVKGGVVIISASIGALLNLWQHRLLPHHHHDNATSRAQRLHILADLWSSIAVVVSGVLIWHTGWFWIDPLLTALVILVIGRQTTKIFFI